MIKKVFIIGAGSNVMLNFPTGTDLRDAILEGNCEHFGTTDGSKYVQFLNDFRFSRNRSIDRYIERNRDFANLGKFLIAYYLSKKEREAVSLLDVDNFEDNWYFDLFNRILEGFPDIDEQIIFISFNYDRSLEYYIRKAIDKTFIAPLNFETTAHKDKFDKLKQKLNERFIFEYVYGKIGDLGQYPYGRGTGYEFVDAISKDIKLITDERKEEITSITKHVISANLIYVIGFGFDKINMEYIGLNSERITTKAVFSTSHSMGLAERLKIVNSFSGGHREVLKFYHPEKKITQFLRDLYVSSFSHGEIIQLKEHAIHPDDIPMVKIQKW